MNHFLTAYLLGAALFLLGSVLWAITESSKNSDEKTASLIVTNTILWPLILIGFIIFGCVSGVKYHVRAFKDNLPR